MENNLVSVVVPVYNSEKYIEECLNSLVNQTYRNIEIIAVDDGSKDKSSLIIRKMSEKDHRIKYFYKDNSGVSDTRNFGIKKISGDYVTFVDSDDWVSQTFVEQAIKYMVDNQLDIIIGGTEKKYRNHTDKFSINSESLIIYTGKELKYLENKIVGYTSEDLPEIDQCFMSGSVCKIFKKEIIDDLKFNNSLKIGEDTIYNIETIRKSKRVGISPEIWYYYRMNAESATQKFNFSFNSDIQKTLIQLKKLDVEKKSFDKRGILSLNSVFEAYPFHKESKMNFLMKRSFIKEICEEPFWCETLNKINIKSIKNRKFKLIIFLCKNKMYSVLVFIYNVKIFVKSKKKKV